MRATFLCVLTLLVYNLWFERRETPDKDDVDTDPFYAGRICERHLYPSYLGTRNCWSYLGMPPGGTARYDRHLYPGYIGNHPSVPDPALEYLGGSRARMGTIDVRELNCETSMYPSYLGNTAAWNACRRAKGLPVAGE